MSGNTFVMSGNTMLWGFTFKCFGWLESYIDLTGLKYYGEITEYVRNIKET